MPARESRRPGPGISARVLPAILPFLLLLTAAALPGRGCLPTTEQEPQEPLPYRDPDLSVTQRVEDLLGRMTLEEKVAQLQCIISEPEAWKPYLESTLGGVGTFLRAYDPRESAERMNDLQRRFLEETRLGIPVLMHDEALHGLVGRGGTSFPQAIALASSWDTDLMHRVATAIGLETRSRGIRQVLSPVVNIARDVRWGRVEETYGEDPYLTARMGVAFCRAIEGLGVVTTPKHFVANIGDGGRDSNPVHFSERLLREIYFPAFKACFQEAGARSVMSAYNSWDGTPCTSSRFLLSEVLRDEWGFRGFTVSDYGSVGGIWSLHRTAATLEETAAEALAAGLNVELPNIYVYGEPLLEALRSGLVGEEILDSAVWEVLQVKFELGLFDEPFVDPEEAARVNDCTAHRALALEAARKGIVLLQNSGDLLPLPGDLDVVAVLGPLADRVRLGGYSGSGMETVSVLRGIRELLGDGVEIRYAEGADLERLGHPAIPPEAFFTGETPADVSGLRAEFFNNMSLEGPPVLRRDDAQIDFDWEGGSPHSNVNADRFSVRWTGIIVPDRSGPVELSITTDDGYRLWLDDRLVAEHWSDRAPTTDFVTVTFEAGRACRLKLEYYENGGGAVAILGWETAEAGSEKLRRALAAVQGAEAAVIVAGVSEGEGRDRARLDLPPEQVELIEAVTATGVPTVVVLMTGSAVTMPGWGDMVPAVMQAWYAGEEGGRAVAEVLFGVTNPSGRLPLTWPRSVAQVPLYYNYKPTGRGYGYVDMPGTPRYAFGHGLSYTTFAYSELDITPERIGPDGEAMVTLKVTNTGPCAGEEVVQLYLHDVIGSVSRPVAELKGFRRVRLEPGEEEWVGFPITPDRLAFPGPDLEWIVEPGLIEVMVGASSQDIRLQGTFEIADSWGRVPAEPAEPIDPSMQGPIRVEYTGQADLTGDGTPEQVVASAEGPEWDALRVRLEIRSQDGSVLYADEWMSGDWCGGYGFYETREVTVEEWVCRRLERLVDPEAFRPGGERAGRFGYGGREGLRSGVREALIEEAWRDHTGAPIDDHVWHHEDHRTIRSTYSDQVSEAEVDALLQKVGDGPDFIYNPHWDALYGLAWCKEYGRFLRILFIG